MVYFTPKVALASFYLKEVDVLPKGSQLFLLSSPLGPAIQEEELFALPPLLALVLHFCVSLLFESFSWRLTKGLVALH